MKNLFLLLFTIISFNFFAQTDAFYCNSGITKLRAQNYQGAVEDFTKAIELNPKNANAYYNRAICENRLYNYKAAVDDFDKAAQLNPKDAWAVKNGNLSRQYLARAGGTSQDFNSYPNDAEKYAKSALIKQKIADYEGAVKDYDLAIALNPKAGYYFGRGDAKYNLKLYANAVEDFTKAIELDSKYAKAYLNRGSAQYSLSNKTAACADWQRALQLGISQAGDAITKFCK